MQKIGELTEQLASAIVMVDPSDLPGLAQVHEHLHNLGQLIGELTDVTPQQADGLRQTAASAEKMVEQVILREVADAVAVLGDVSKAVTQLQGLLDGKIEAPASAPAAAAHPPAAAETANPQAAPATLSPPSAATAPPTAINPDDAPLVQEFITESTGHIEAAEAALLQVEENPRDTESLSAIFRAFHTIKGVAGFLNLKDIGSLAHAAENLLDLARHEKIVLEGTLVDVVLESIDMMKAMMGDLNQALGSNSPPQTQSRLPAMLQRLHDAAEGKLTVPAAPTPAAVTGPTEAASATPSGPAAAESAAPAAAAAKTATTATTGETTVKVATDRLDSLINMVGELVIAQSMASEDLRTVVNSDQRISRNMSHLGKITRELQDLSMSMRMVPIQGVFQKMARLVRDLGRKGLKEIDFSVVGGETELDRNVVEAISDPLVHMIRNSVDHGIEPPDQRVAAGKPRAGKIELKAYHHSGNIVIEIIDDGRGLNKARILKKAIDNGIVREGQELSDQEIFKLIFAAGLSTAEKVTDVSGRGVGMDVVKRNVEALRGRIDISSAEGKGSVFTIRLPLTLAIIDGQIISVGNQRFIIPITSIEQSIQPKPEQLSTVQNRGEMCMVRSQLLPVFRLYRLFGITPRNEDPTKSLVVIVQDDQKRCCLLVDDLQGQQQVVIKTLGEALGHIPGISGGAILGDGNVSLILDIPGLIHLATGQAE